MKNIVLIGMMGCGKSTCGRLLQQALGMPLVDTDQLIEAREGMTVSDIFAQKGEPYFRDLETAVTRELSQRSGIIIATGGGLPMREENRALLRASGLVVFLNRPAEQIFDGSDLEDRPLAQQGKADFLRRFQERTPLYRAAAHYEIHSAPLSEQTAAKVLALWKEWNSDEASGTART